MSDTATASEAPSSEPTGLSPSDWIDRLLAPFGLPWTAGEGVRFPRTDVADTGPSYRIVADLPGVPKASVDVRILGSSVEIHAKGPAPPREGALHRERSSAAYYRALELPEPVVGANATATLSDGVLTLEVPKLRPVPAATEVRVEVR